MAQKMTKDQHRLAQSLDSGTERGSHWWLSSCQRGSGTVRVTRNAAVLLIGVMALLGAMFVAAAPSQAQAGPPEGPGSIDIIQTPSGVGGLCLPPALALRRSTSNDATTFRLTIRVVAPLCSRVNAVAAIYRMPGNGVAWPQNLVQTVPFTLREPGVTEVIFTKGCEPVQFDVITGATPPTISPFGPYHGPLLFPFDLSTSLQWWGCGPTPTTTTTSSTTSSTTTTIDDNCENYTPGSVTVSPSTATPGDTLTVTGTGTPGTMIQVLLRPPPDTDPDLLSPAVRAAGFIALSDPVLVQPDGTWSTTVYIPTDGQLGTWIVSAQAVDCDIEVTTDVEVSNGSSIVSSTTEGPVVAGESQVRELPSSAISDPQAGAANAKVAGLAFTGSATHLPVVVGILLIAVGGLLLLGTRRRSEA